MNIEIFLQKDILAFLEDTAKFGKKEDRKSGDELAELLKPNQEEDSLPQAGMKTGTTEIHADKIVIKQDATGLPPPFPIEQEKAVISQIASEAAKEATKVATKEVAEHEMKELDEQKIIAEEQRKAQQEAWAKLEEEKKKAQDEAQVKLEEETKKIEAEHQQKIQDLQAHEAKEQSKSKRILGSLLRENKKEQEELDAANKKAQEEHLAREEAEQKAKTIQEQASTEKSWLELDEQAKADEEKRQREEQLREKIDDAILKENIKYINKYLK